MIEFVDPRALRVHPLNEKVCDDLGPLVESIAEHGVLSVIGVDPEGVLVAGAHRTAAAIRAGLDVVPVSRTVGMSSGAHHRALAADEHTRGLPVREGLRVEGFAPFSPDGRWGTGVVTGVIEESDWTPPEREAHLAARRAAADGMIVGNVVAAPDGTIVDGWWWAMRAAASGRRALVRLHGEAIDVPQVARWSTAATSAHPAHARFATPRQHRRISPLYEWLTAEVPAGRVLDIGCGWGWHIGDLGQSHPELKVTGYEPYRRQRKARKILPAVDRQWVRGAIRRVAAETAQDGPYDHVVVDHVLFLTGSDEAALTLLRAAASLLADDGILWLANRHRPLTDMVSLPVDDRRRFGVRGDAKYLFTTWPTDLLTAELTALFGRIESKAMNASRLFRCQGPIVRDPESVRAEFDLEWPDGTRPGVVDDLVEVVESWPTR